MAQDPLTISDSDTTDSDWEVAEVLDAGTSGIGQPRKSSWETAEIEDQNVDYSAGRLESGVGQFSRGVGDIVASVPQSVGEVSGFLQGTDPDETAGADVAEKVRGFFQGVQEINPNFSDEWTQKLARGAGSMAGFMAGGVAGAAAKLPAWLGAAGLGATATGVEQVEDLKAIVGEDPDADERAKALGFGGLLGLSEAAPIARIFGRLDKVTGGGVKRVLSEGAKGSVEEAAQEVFQTLGQNLIASDVLKYDPERNQWEGAAEAGSIGGTLGFLFNSLAAGVGSRRMKRMADQQQATEQPEQRAGDVEVQEWEVDEVIDMEGGAAQDFSSVPVDEEVDLYKYGPGGEPKPAPREAGPQEIVMEGGAEGPSTAGIQVEDVTDQIPTVTDRIDQRPSTEGIDVQEVQPEEVEAQDVRPSTAGIEVEEIEPDDITMSGGAPFPTQKAAELKAKTKALSDRVAVKTPEGWVLRKTEPARHVEGEVVPRGQEITVTSKEQLDQAATTAATHPDTAAPEPTEAQKQAGNYRKPRVRVNGLPITIENPKGSQRSGKSRDGKAWSQTMRDHYGYIRGVEGADKDKLDIFLGPRATDPNLPVHVVDQVDPETGKFDEHKAVAGARSEEEARKIYQRNYEKGWQGLGAITPLPLDEFKQWTESGNTKKPLALPAPEAQQPRKAKPEKPQKQAKTAEKSRSRQGFDPGRDSITEAVAKLGGINRDDVGGDLNEGVMFQFDKRGRRQPVRAPGTTQPIVRATGGMTIDAMAENLSQFGYPVTDETGAFSRNVLIDAINEEAAGRPVYSDYRSAESMDEQLNEEMERLYGEQREETVEEIEQALWNDAIGDLAPGEGETLTETQAKIRDILPRAQEIDEGAAESALEAETDAEALRRLQEVIDGAEQVQEGREAVSQETESREEEQAEAGEFALTPQDSPKPTEPAQPAEEQGDMLPPATTGEQARQVQTDRQKAQQASPDMDQGEGDLFSDKSKQRDVEDVSKAGPEYTFETQTGHAAAVNSVEDAVEKWEQLRDDERIEGGVRDIGSGGVVKKNGKPVARISYNGRVWDMDGQPLNRDGTQPAEPARKTPTKPKKKAKKKATKKASTEKKPAQQEVELQEDVGENLWYNRRNFTGKGIQWGDVKDLNDTLKLKEVVKSKVWIRPNYEQLIDEGMNPLFARIIKHVYDGIAAKPQGASDEALQTYIDAVNKVREQVFEWAKDNNSNREFLQMAMGRIQGEAGVQSDVESGKAVDVSTLLRGSEQAQQMRSVLLNRIWPSEQGKPGYASFDRNTDAGKEIRAVGGNRALKHLQISIKDITKFLDDIGEGWPAKREAWQRTYRVAKTKDEARVGKGFRYSDEDRSKQDVYFARIGVRTIGSHDNEADAQAEIDALPEWVLMRKKGGVVDYFQTREEAVEAARGKTQRRQGQGGELRGMNIGDSERVGPERREKGQDISSQELMDTFGFRGVNFGRKGWINAAERQEYLNAAYDGLLDLAEILEVPPKAISLNGVLGIAFGAQGRGGQNAAHFVPGVNEINLTKTQGAGTLAHEWGHALDHYFAVQAGLAKANDPFLSAYAGNKRVQNSEIRPEIVDGFKRIVETMNRRNETPEEHAQRIERTKESTKKRLDEWLRYTESRLVAAEANQSIMDRFKEYADRIRKGDLGGYQKSGNKAFPEAVAGVRNLFKETTGRLWSLDNINLLDSYAHSNKTFMERQEADQKHIPVSTQYARESRKKDRDKGGKDYWSTEWEMFARAFETYVASKLVEQQRLNTFLSDAHRRAEARGTDNEVLQPYPRETERAAINSAFDDLVSSIETRETDQGVGMFSTAYHASPYTFDRFDISKIGTGEGNQAYGYGLYLAENPVVGGEYLSIFDAVAGYDYPSDVDRIDGGLATSVLRAADGDKDLAIQMVKDREFLPSSLTDRTDAVVDAIGKAERKSASLYKVDVSDSAVAKLLDWDKPLSEQPRVQSAFEVVAQDLDNPALLDEVQSGEMTAGGIYKMATSAIGDQVENKSKMVSDALNEAGIPGIKYLDQGSRAQGEGTRNFVIFDDSLITILERNGEPVTGAEREQALASMRSESTTPVGMSVTDATNSLRQIVGKKAFDRLVGAGRFEIVQKQMEIPEVARRSEAGEAAPGRVKGMYSPTERKSYIVAGNVSPDQIQGVFLHEVGAHYGLPRMIGRKEYEKIKRQLQNLHRIGNKRVVEARNRVPKNTPQQYVWDETLAYLAENPANHNMSLLKSVWTKIKAFLKEIGVLHAVDLSDADIVQMVRGAAKHAARTAPRRPVRTRPGVYDKVAKGLTPKGTAQSYARQVRQMVRDGQITQAQADRIIPWLNQHKRTPSPSERLDETVLDIPARRSKTIRRDDVLAFLSSQGLMSQESRQKQRLRDMGMDFENLPGDEQGNPTRPTEPVDEVPEEVDTGTARTNLQEQGFEAPEDEGFNGPDAPEGMFSIEREYTEEQKRAIEKGKFGERGAQPTARERIKAAKYLAGTKIRQGVVDQFASLKNILGDTRAWMMAQISQATTGALEATVDYGRPFLRDNAIGVDVSQNSLKDVLEPLGVELDDWLKWMAGNRAERLKAQDRERLFDEGDIRALKSLNQGRMADGRNRAEVYEQVRQEFETLSQAVNQIAVDTGLVNEQEAREWAEQGFYLPFYRMLEGESRGPRVFKNGLAKQTAYKKLKGADVALDDLLGNLLTNWNHLLSASMRNQAAVRSLHTAEQMGIAQRVSQAEASKDAIWVREDGQQVWYEFDDTPEAKLVMDSLLSLNYEGLRQFSMRVMRRFKRALTVGVTVNPEFRIANLIRDTLHSAAVVPVSTNIAKNVIQGVRMTKRGTQSQASMIAGGGAFGDSGYIHGTDPELIRRTIAKGVGRDTILDTRGRVRKMWDKYQDFGARMENVNRAAAFAQAVQNGQDLLEANFEARDLLDFQRTGGFTFVRALTQTVPFLNARLQGLDKMYRAVRTPGQRRQFATISGVYALAAVGLYLMMKDDDDYNEAEEWEKDAYHLFKIPGSDVMYRIPKPFEVGVIGTMAERLTEQVVDDNVHGTLFAERMWHALQETLSFNPIPQAALPMIELVSNKSFFTGRNIENLSMSRLSPEERKRAWTSQTAIGASQAMSKILWDDVVLSPVQVEHLVNGYLGWMGGSILGATDMLVSRPLAQSPDQPERRIEDYPVVGRFIREADSRNSKFVTRFYENLNDVTYAWGDIRQARELGNREKASAKIEENRDVLKYREAYNRVQRTFGKINSRITQIHMDETLTPKQKRNKIDLLNKRKKQIARRIVEASSDAFH